ncbi:DLW-39 family protein [Arthrobacter sp. ISL-48]|uniref:DLW-39 family protein n=1 Tax=Arthrobacter sp. ISL-48 TaxID=2819110 RepID=UPI00288C4B26|nr:DLW-39 family protein [Arthrobacter sp. ISL-48]
MQVHGGSVYASRQSRNGVHVKKLLVLAAAIAGVLLYKKAQESEARKTVWSKSTDTVH